ncbi:MAG: hypothetical protein Q4C49_12990 [Bacillota bacterium]|nr:hypothetical protein [Bacillota bacterium]
METRTLNTIQKLMKAGGIISTLIQVLCTIGIVGCVIGIVSLYVFPANQAVQLCSMAIHQMIHVEIEKLSFSSYITAMLMGLIICSLEVNLARSARKYFRNELKAGTPFTFEGVEELKRLGIRIIVLPIVAVIIANIVHKSMCYYFKDVATMHINSFVVGRAGLLCIFLSCIYKYGAELVEKK